MLYREAKHEPGSGYIVAAGKITRNRIYLTGSEIYI
jgi:hypothetical protein